MPAAEKILVIFWCSLSLIAMGACIGSGHHGKDEPGDLFLDYKVSGEEGNDSVTVLLQFRIDDENGPAVGIPAPGKVMLDAMEITPDSTPVTGVYYEATRPLNSFTGKHTITFVDIDRKVYKENFIFRAFTLAPLGDTIVRGRVDLHFEGLAAEDYVRVILTDTSYLGDGINRLDTVSSNRDYLTREDLRALADGPVQLQLTREDQHEIDAAPPPGGLVSIGYTLRREFFLRSRGR